MGFFKSNVVRKPEPCKEIQISEIEEVEVFPGTTAVAYHMLQEKVPTWHIPLYDNEHLCKYFDVDPEIIRKKKQQEIQKKREARIHEFNRKYNRLHRRREMYENMQESIAENFAESKLVNNVMDFFIWLCNMTISCCAAIIMGSFTKFCIEKYTQAIHFIDLKLKYTGVIIQDPNTVLKIFQPLSYIGAAGVTVCIIIVLKLVYKAYKKVDKFFND